jgi:hypothetical protein
MIRPAGQTGEIASPKPADLHRSPGQTEIRGRREHVAVVGPHIVFSDVLRRCQVHGVGGAYEEIARSGNHQCTGPPQQSLVYWNQIPQSVFNVPEEARGQLARVFEAQDTFTQAAMKHGMQLGQCPDR